MTVIEIKETNSIASIELSGGISPQWFDAKGDLLVGLADNTFDRQAVGTDDYPLVADSSETTGVAYKQLPVGGIADATITYAKIQNVSATDRLLGRDTAGAGVIEEIAPAAARTILNVEDGAEVTSTAKVNSAGAVMETDYNANTILAATVDDTPEAITVGEQTVMGRITAGAIKALSVTELRTLIDLTAQITGTKLDDLTAGDDNTDLDATTSAHGLLFKLGGGTTNFLRADGSWAAPGVPVVDSFPSAMGGRISLTTGVAVTTSDVADATSLYWVPYGVNGGLCSLFDGTVWQPVLLTELTDTNAGFTTSKPHDIFVDYNGGTPVLEKLAWTDATTRATALVLQDGRHVLTGALDWNYVGTVYLDSADTFQDTAAQRFVWNYYNRRIRRMQVRDATASWTYSATAYGPMNGNASNKAEFIIGVSEDLVSAVGIVRVTLQTNTTAYSAITSIGLDAQNAIATNAVLGFLNTTVDNEYLDSSLPTTYKGYPGIGYHYLAPIEAAGVAGRSVTFFGGNYQLFTAEVLG